MDVTRKKSSEQDVIKDVTRIYVKLIWTEVRTKTEQETG
jgi:hypothetical protein